LERVGTSVSDPGCLSLILILFPSRIPDPTAKKRRGGKIASLFVAINLTKLKIINYFNFEQVPYRTSQKKKNLGQLKKN
jgi:hypothetical protein